MAVRIQLRRDTAANWTFANPVLGSGEMAVETDTLKLKVGDGSTAWNLLDYVGGTSEGGSGGDGSYEISTGNVTGALNLNLDNHKNVNVYGTIRGNVTLSFSNVPSTGAVMVTYVVAQNNVGGHTLTYPGGTVFLNGGDGSINPAANSVSVVSLVSTNAGANWVVAVSDSRPTQYEAFYFNPSDNGPIYVRIPYPMTLNVAGTTQAGTGTLAYARSTNNGSSFTNISTSTSFGTGDILRVTVSGIGAWLTFTIPRTA